MVKRPLKTLTRKKAIELGQQFVDELTEEFGITFLYWFDGSIATKKYVAGKSDIDLVIIPDESCDYGKILMRMVKMMEEYGNTYGQVFKHGRDVSVIDPMLFLNVNMLYKWNAFYHEVLEPTLDKNKCMKRIKINIKEVQEFEKKWQDLENQKQIQNHSK